MTQKLKIVETADYILAVSEEEIQNGYYYNVLDKALRKGYAEQSYHTSVIGYLPKGDAKKLYLPLLPELVVEDDVEKLAKEYSKSRREITTAYTSFVDGYKAATKIYSEEDFARVLFDFGDVLFNNCQNGISEDDLRKYEKIILDSLKQPKTPKYFVAETITMNKGYTDKNDYPYQECEVLKTKKINGKTYLTGTYIY
jgi:hypothetical protein